MRVIGQGACSGMAGFLCLPVLMEPPFADASESAVHLVEVALGRYNPGVLIDWSPSDGFDAVEAASQMPGDPDVWTDGGIRSLGYLPLVLVSLPVSQRIAGVVVGGVMLIVFAPRVRFSLVGAFVLFLCLFSRSIGLKCGVSFWLCSRVILCTWVLTILEWFVMLAVCWMDVVVPLLLNLSLMVIFFCLLRGCFIFEVLPRFRLPISRVMLMRIWFWKIGLENLTGWVTALLMRLLTLVVGGLVMLSLMRGVTCLGSVVGGILSFLIFTVSLLPSLGAVVNHDGSDPLVCSAGAFPKSRRIGHAVRDRVMLPEPPAIWESEMGQRACLRCWCG